MKWRRYCAIVRRHEAGQSMRVIAAALRCSVSSVAWAVARHEARCGAVEHMPLVGQWDEKRGRVVAYTDQERRRIRERSRVAFEARVQRISRGKPDE